MHCRKPLQPSPDRVEILVPLLLIAIGLALIAVEVYLIPGFNVIGILGLLSLMFAVGYAFSTSGFAGGVLTLAGALSATGMLYYVLWTSGAWQRFVLSTTVTDDAALRAKEQETRSRYLGKEGVALTPLRPTGVAEIEEERVEVVTEGGFIAAGSRIRVVAMDRRRFFVRLATDRLPEATPEVLPPRA